MENKGHHYYYCYFAPGRGCQMLRRACLYACLSVCLCVCLSSRISQKNDIQTSQNFLYMLPVAMAQTSMATMQQIAYFLCCG